MSNDGSHILRVVSLTFHEPLASRRSYRSWLKRDDVSRRPSDKKLTSIIWTPTPRDGRTDGRTDGRRRKLTARQRDRSTSSERATSSESEREFTAAGATLVRLASECRQRGAEVALAARRHKCY